MHGGMKVYRGAPAPARNYVEVDRSRADDYYLAEGSGLAMRVVAGNLGVETVAVRPPQPAVRRLRDMDGESYERWVAGLDLESGRPKGRLRKDGSAARIGDTSLRC